MPIVTELNPIPTGCGHVTLINGLILPMAGRNRVKNRNAFSGKKEGVYGHLSMSRVKSLIFIALVEKKIRLGRCSSKKIIVYVPLLEVTCLPFFFGGPDFVHCDQNRPNI